MYELVVPLRYYVCVCASKNLRILYVLQSVYLYMYVRQNIYACMCIHMHACRDMLRDCIYIYAFNIPEGRVYSWIYACKYVPRDCDVCTRT